MAAPDSTPVAGGFGVPGVVVPGLIVHRAAHGADLVAALAEVLRTPPADPFEPDLVAVPAKGVERWLAQRLSATLGGTRHDGVCANVAFPWPSTLLDDAVASVSPEHAQAVEAWSPVRLRWVLLDLLDSTGGEPWNRPLAAHLGTPSSGRRLALAGRLAGLFDQYAQNRPQMLRDWATGRDTRGDDCAVPDDLLWQPELWRAARDELNLPSPSELLDVACERLRAEPEHSRLPARLSLVGVTQLSRARLKVLAALATHREIHLFVHHPSPALWARLAHQPAHLHRSAAQRFAQHPLLASMGRDLIELQQQIAAVIPGSSDVLRERSTHGEMTLLRALKEDLAADRAPDQRYPMAEGDRSIQVHACHGRTRQVEVLREVVTGLLANSPQLTPDDVIVLCPDVETFAPLIAATFALAGSQHPAASLRVRLADRALHQTNDLLAVLNLLLETCATRITSAQVLDLAGHPAVRRRFGFDDTDGERLRQWTVGAAVRWGLDQEHRADWGLGALAQGTWRVGLDRLLLGASMEGDRDSFGGVLPLDDVDSADIDLAGRFAELVDRLAAAEALCSGRHPVEVWTTELTEIALSLAGTTLETAWQEVALRGELADLAATAGGHDADLSLADVRVLLAELLAGRPTRASFRTGALTVCTLVPMRSVPHRVVCLLGLDDGVFPRVTGRDGDDMLAREPWVGERDPRSEDRQLMLDAVGAAEEHLVIIYTGADERTGVAVPPAVPLGELLDTLDRTASAPDKLAVHDLVVTHHPLQPFDPRNFSGGTPFSFDPQAFAGAQALGGKRAHAVPLITSALPDQKRTQIELSELRRLLLHPTRGFLRQRLGVSSSWAQEEPVESLPVTLDNLEQWALGERLLAQRLAGGEPDSCVRAERQRGLLPPGQLGESILREVGSQVDALVSACADEWSDAPQVHGVDVVVGGVRVTGTVGQVRGAVVTTVSYSKLGPKHRLLAWIDLVALTVADPQHPWRALALGRGTKGGAVRCQLGPLSETVARESMAILLQLYAAGLCTPLPLPLKAGARYASLRQIGTSVPRSRGEAERAWASSTFPGECADDEHVMIYGKAAPLLALTGMRPEEGEHWFADETDRFGQLARQLWTPVLDAESRGWS